MASFVVVLFGSVGTGLSGAGLSLCLRRRGTGWTRSVSTHSLVEYGLWYRARVDLNWYTPEKFGVLYWDIV